MTRSVRVAIIGAGPYALSIAAHLRARGVGFRIFGNPMESWRSRMPAGMFLKSEGFASNIYDPERRFTLKSFCTHNGLSYADTGLPIPLETMAMYGLSFQRQLVPEVENKTVVALDWSLRDFLLQLDSGEMLSARRVIVAVGSSYFKYVPPSLTHLPAPLLSHSSDHHDLSRFGGQDVTVVGCGASALDLATLLRENGAQVHLVARQPSVVFLSKPVPRSLWHRIRYPMSGIGGGWRSRFFADAPMLFRYLPQPIRVRTVKTYLGPAGGWFVKDRIVGRVHFLLARTPRYAEVKDGRVYLQCEGESGQSEVLTDHIIAATGYRVDIGRLEFLSEKIRASLQSIENAPVLSKNFESSVPGLYFVGLASAYCFGPVMRFLFGAGYTAGRLSEHLSSFSTS
jgi:Pyridine nucleotide-disulphide oxidoreductase